MSEKNLHLEVDRSDSTKTRIQAEPSAALAPGCVRFHIDRFAVTANNVTYATIGHTLGYWDFFPTGDPQWGRVPAMGFGEVVASEHPDVAEVAIVAVRDRRWGEAGCAFVVPASGTTCNAQALRAWAGERLAKFKLPREFLSIDALPRTETGKVQKHLLVRLAETRVAAPAL